VATWFSYARMRRHPGRQPPMPPPAELARLPYQVIGVGPLANARAISAQLGLDNLVFLTRIGTRVTRIPVRWTRFLPDRSATLARSLEPQ